jgi:hypothetical protein
MFKWLRKKNPAYKIVPKGGLYMPRGHVIIGLYYDLLEKPVPKQCALDAIESSKKNRFRNDIILEVK